LYYLSVAVYFLYPVALGIIPFFLVKGSKFRVRLKNAVLILSPMHILILSVLLFMWREGPDFTLAVPAIVYAILALNDIIWFKYSWDLSKRLKSNADK
jgi:heme/copper-type cytochrome/quinol oxidase subunit 4